MTAYATRRILIAIPTLLVISLVVYFVLALAPGDPLSNLASSTDIPAEVRENIRRQFGLLVRQPDPSLGADQAAHPDHALGDRAGLRDGRPYRDPARRDHSDPPILLA